MLFTEILSVALILTCVLLIWGMPFIVITLAVSPSIKDKFICKIITISSVIFIIFSAIYLHYFPVDAEYMRKRSKDIAMVCKTQDTYMRNGNTMLCPNSMSHSAD